MGSRRRLHVPVLARSRITSRSSGFVPASGEVYQLNLINATSRAALVSAWGFERMNQSYVGPLINVQDITAGTSQDFGTGAKEIDATIQAAITTYLGGHVGSISAYDQISSNLLTNPTDALKPSYLVYTGFACADFNGTTHFWRADGVAAPFTGVDKPMTIHQVRFQDTNTLTDTFWGFAASAATTSLFEETTNTTTHVISRRDAAGLTISKATTTVIGAATTAKIRVHNTRYTGTVLNSGFNGNLMQNMVAASMDTGSITLDRFTVGARVSGNTGPPATGANYADMKWFKQIVFSIDIGAAEAAILNAYDVSHYNSIPMGVLPFTATNVPDLVDSLIVPGFTTTGLYRANDGLSWYVGNHGYQPNRDDQVLTAYRESIVNLSLDFTTKLGELDCSLIDANTSIQDISIAVDGSFWLARPIEGKVNHYSAAGVDLGDGFNLVAANGLDLDRELNKFWALRSDNGNLHRLSLTGVVEVTQATTGTTDPDLLYAEPNSDFVWVTNATNGSTGLVHAYNKRTGLWPAAIYKIAGTTTIEGIFIDGLNVYISSDGGFHSGTPNINQILTCTRSLLSPYNP